MIRTYEETFDASRAALHDALVSYLHSKPEHYCDVSEDPAELRAHLSGSFFAYHADLVLSATERMGGSALSVRIRTHPLFFMDPLGFWRRYVGFVANNLRRQLTR